MPALTFEEGVTVELKTVTGLTTKVFPIIAPEGTLPPYVTTEPSRRNFDKTLSGFLTSCTQHCNVDVFEDNQSEVIALANAVKAEIATWLGTAIGTTGPTLEDVSFDDDVDPIFEPALDMFRIPIGFEVRY